MSTKTEIWNASSAKPCTVISQPMFLPWRGLFEQICLSDDFVFYDDVQLPLGGGRGRGFTTRVQIKTPSGVEWMNIPVERAGRGKQLINEVRFAHDDWRRSHLERLRQAYRSAPHFRSVHESLVREIYAIDTTSLGEFCIRSTRMLAEAMGLRPRWHVSSEMSYDRELGASERVRLICQQLGAKKYVSGLGAMQYLDYDLFERASIQVCYMDYEAFIYPQLHGGFTPYVSILDMLYSLGMDATAAALCSNATYWRDWPYMCDGRPTTVVA